VNHRFPRGVESVICSRCQCGFSTLKLQGLNRVRKNCPYLLNCLFDTSLFVN